MASADEGGRLGGRRLQRRSQWRRRRWWRRFAAAAASLAQRRRLQVVPAVRERVPARADVHFDAGRARTALGGAALLHQAQHPQGPQEAAAAAAEAAAAQVRPRSAQAKVHVPPRRGRGRRQVFQECHFQRFDAHAKSNALSLLRCWWFINSKCSLQLNKKLIKLTNIYF